MNRLQHLINAGVPHEELSYVLYTQPSEHVMGLFEPTSYSSGEDLHLAFDWAETPQGYNFWHGWYEKLLPKHLPDRIAFAGPKGAGKSTAAEALQQQWGGRIYSLAYPIKQMRRALLRAQGLSPDPETTAALDGVPEGPLAVTARYLDQTIGTEWGREYLDRAAWTRMLLRRASRTSDSPKIVDDVRRLDEARALERAGFRIIRIDVAEKGTDPHVSEREADRIPADVRIENTKNGINAFRCLVLDVVGSMG